MKKEREPVTIEKVKEIHSARGEDIRTKLAEFEAIWQEGSDEKLWEEMVFCFFTGGCSARMGLRSIEAVRSILLTGDHEELMNALVGKHRYPRARAGYIVASRDFLQEHCGMQLRKKLNSFGNDLERRDWLVKEKRIKGLGYKEASHFLRNIGLKGYAILDKHILRSLAELGFIDEPTPPNTRTKYLAIENKLKEFAQQVEIDFDEMDLVLWSLKTGEILK
ncbi:MAG TPA: N-glycosylase/DNA lyase [Pyrinomonadaceae bacterium]|nr:N-glycosylase/DNA lyase [Pyrinomonadaceae bacterium]